ncbi:MAG: phosphoribosylglycinamide formyltransferase [Endomicrobium sp.]|jgi:formyltetrahydrofolate-dependent phosphoribosylglycinamide formyltransferase|nr:phosphoribosylglycinamide formyltransferase [Endomicrobium sp.]
MKNLAILVSGNGSNMKSIINSTKYGILKGFAKVVLVISNNPSAYALERIKTEQIKSVCIEIKNFKNENEFNDKILNELKSMEIDIVCLAGYLKKINKKIIITYKGKILNVHPALLPKFGGKGMYGNRVHKAVIMSNAKKSGATVHLVEGDYDIGKIILQKEIKILKTDTYQNVAKKVLSIEHHIYPKAIKKIIHKL